MAGNCGCSGASSCNCGDKWTRRAALTLQYGTWLSSARTPRLARQRGVGEG
ncbi:hypothetical protein MGG_17265 [Pyricularia oryzae 70-15]|uniref:Uncharacterized protein n=3 Tax=Pyricularia oryzae TaxID=318829 RepID=G4NA05_PYRO7|nr:uncharacterized protein MGG_17265 [Pyricularia oryzae 70-15]EHA51251.1 hypothetical protein MGG_17265 [Pyricularia oryzae 70-15]ELQ41786.1 hypothetical protein OOU_Y34scaffold00254g4 [Pyricularia oryzae Y34]